MEFRGYLDSYSRQSIENRIQEIARTIKEIAEHDDDIDSLSWENSRIIIMEVEEETSHFDSWNTFTSLKISICSSNYWNPSVWYICKALIFSASYSCMEGRLEWKDHQRACQVWAIILIYKLVYKCCILNHRRDSNAVLQKIESQKSEGLCEYCIGLWDIKSEI